MTTVERLAARVLLWGGVLSIGLMLAGLIGYGVRGRIGHEAFDTRRLFQAHAQGRAANLFALLTGIRRGLARWPADPTALTALGMVILLVTPIVAVALALPAFARRGDGRYVIISAALLAALVLGLVFGNGG